MNHNKDSINQASNFIKKRLQHRCFPVINAKLLKTFILKNIYERLFLLFWFLEDILEVAVCRGSTKSASTGVPFQ